MATSRGAGRRAGSSAPLDGAATSPDRATGQAAPSAGTSQFAFPPAAADAAAPATRHVSNESLAMGGSLAIHIEARPAEAGIAARDAALVAERVRAWAARLTRHDPTSELMRLNAELSRRVTAGPTLAACLAWSRDAAAITGGVVDPTLFGERLAAEAGTAPAPVTDRRWSLVCPDRSARGAVVERPPGLRLDLDGVAKGWIADRAVRLLDRHPRALVDADGDIAIHVDDGDPWEIGVGDPRDPSMLLAILLLGSEAGGRDGRVGVATSGISVHAWGADRRRHHLIDPHTGRPAVTDVVQATVIAGSAALAEAWAKAAVILGGAAALDALERARVRGAIILLADGRTVALPRTTRYIA